MPKLSGYGPSLVVLVSALLLLLAGPSVVRELTYQQTTVQIERASHRLGNNNVLEQIDQAYQDIAAFVEPSVVHISARHPVGSRIATR